MGGIHFEFGKVRNWPTILQPLRRARRFRTVSRTTMEFRLKYWPGLRLFTFLVPFDGTGT